MAKDEQPIIKKRRRLSRKEQKARKKQKKRQELSEQAASSKPFSDDVVSTQSDAAEATAIDEDYSASYVPTPIPTQVSDFQECKSLGKWFPKAVKLKRQQVQLSQDNKLESKKKQKQADTRRRHCSILLFYQYASPELSKERCSLLMQFLLDIGNHRPNLAGRIRIAQEGLNCTLSAVDIVDGSSSSDGSTTISAACTLRHFSMELKRFDAQLFETTDFKYMDGLTADRHFSALTVIPVKELVYYGLSEDKAPLGKGGTHVSPRQFHNMLAGQDDDDDGEQNRSSSKKETVVIDVRNHYEASLGRFDGQQQESSASASATVAKYIDPKMRKSTDFPNWLQQPETQQMLSGKRVLMYCTGGIRCERASAHLIQKLSTAAGSSNGDQVEPPEVYQLQGGIERYLQEFPDGKLWRGKNFTFDKREAVAAGDANGDGGVVDKKKAASTVGATAVLEGCVCVVCNSPWDRYLGKKHCRMCGVPVLVCEACLSQKKDQANDGKSLRCPLCVEEDVTVPAEEVDWTDNGVKVVPSNPQGGNSANPTASRTVLKWGGSYAADKKVKRKWKRTPCRFGADCIRKDCFFAHPTSKNKGVNQRQHDLLD